MNEYMWLGNKGSGVQEVAALCSIIHSWCYSGDVRGVGEG
jgi:hypothetical protein